MMKRIILPVFSLVLGFVFAANVWATIPGDNAAASGIKTCVEEIEREIGIIVADQPHQSHDFVAPDARNVDKRPFYSMVFRSYTDVGISHITVSAARSDLSRRNVKCDLLISETFFSDRTCEEWSRDLASQDFKAQPLASDVTLMENSGDQSLFSFYYLTDVSGGDGCLVTRRRLAYEN